MPDPRHIAVSFSPVRMDDTYGIARAGPFLFLGNTAFDFSDMPDGSLLPQEAIGSESLAGPVHRTGDTVHVQVRLPCGFDAPDAKRFPLTVEAGDLDGPLLSDPPDDWEVGAIDWTMLLTAGDREELTRPPVPAEISDWQFATVLCEDGVITAQEAEDFAGGGVIPAVLAAAIETIPVDEVKRDIRIKVRGAKTYDRNDWSTLALASLMGYSQDMILDIWSRASRK